MSVKNKLELAMRDYVDKSVLPNAYDAHKHLMKAGKVGTYEEFLDVVLSFMKGKKENEGC